MLTELIQGASSSCSVVCWIALAFTFLSLTAIAVCFAAVFRSEAAQRKHAKRHEHFQTSDKHLHLAA